MIPTLHLCSTGSGITWRGRISPTRDLPVHTRVPFRTVLPLPLPLILALTDRRRLEGEDILPPRPSSGNRPASRSQPGRGFAPREGIPLFRALTSATHTRGYESNIAELGEAGSPWTSDCWQQFSRGRSWRSSRPRTHWLQGSPFTHVRMSTHCSVVTTSFPWGSVHRSTSAADT